MIRHTVTIMPVGETFEYPEGTPILEILEDHGYSTPAPCGGRGVCGKCLVKAQGGLSPKSDTEAALAPDPSMRLACSALIAGDAVIYPVRKRSGCRMDRHEVNAGSEFCMAFDIGTTSIQASLVDRISARRYDICSFLNPQRRFGHDVISRIAACADEKAAAAMTSLLRQELSDVHREITSRFNIRPGAVREIVFSGNTTMIYLLIGLDVRGLGAFPYRASLLDFDPATVRKAVPGSHEKTVVRALPAASAFLGGDLVGGLAFLHHLGHDRSVFFIDIGTNGEMFLRDGEGGIYAASCAMGPALEGMNIECGMTADSGAVDHVCVTDGHVRFSVIDNAQPAGISGTGIVDLIAIMIRAGIVAPDGSFSTPGTAPFPNGISVDHGAKKIVLAPNVFVSQKDIRNVQLAKGASLAAAEMLLDEAKITADRIENVFIAGAFGEHLDLDNFAQLKFLPGFSSARWHFLGNTSLRAAEEYGMSQDFRALTARLRDSIKVVDLHDTFNDRFLRSLDFSPAQK